MFDPVALFGLVDVRVDTAYGEIRPLPGTILGKAAEPWVVGTGTIGVVLTLR